MANNDITVGLMRHGREPPGSIQYYFSSLRQQLQDQFRLKLLPDYFYQINSIDRLKVMMAEFMQDVDILFATNGKTIDHVICPFFVREQQQLDIPIIYQPLGEFPRGAAGFFGAYKYFRTSDSITFSSSADRAIYHNLIQEMPCGDNVIPFGIDTQHFRPREDDTRRRIRRDLGIAEDALVFLYVGRITAEKNVHALLDCFKWLHRDHPHACLLIIGNVGDVPFREFGTGPYDLKSLYRQLPLGDCIENIHFFGGVCSEELPWFYSAADAFVNLTLHHDENFGYTQVEAMACGLPLVVSDWGGLKDTVDPACGFRVPVHMTGHGPRVDRHCAIKAMQWLGKHPDNALAMGEAARRRSVDLYDNAVHGAAIHDLVLQAVHSGSAGKNHPGHLTGTGERLLKRMKDYLGRQETLFSIDDDSGDIYRDLIRPYTGSGAPAAELTDNTCVLASPCIRIDDDVLTVTDPLWPFEYGPVTDAQKALILELETHGVMVLKPGDNSRPYIAPDELQPLITSGVILHCSDYRLPKSPVMRSEHDTR